MRKNTDIVSARWHGMGHEPGMETAVSSVQSPVPGQSRVMAANLKSQNVRPADLDALARGWFKGL